MRLSIGFWITLNQHACFQLPTAAKEALKREKANALDKILKTNIPTRFDSS